MMYNKEINFIVNKIREGYELFGVGSPNTIIQKSGFDLVTEVDKNIEAFISDEIKKCFPDDNILGEEISNNSKIIGRTWTIDPVDGTVNMASGIRLYGIQCSLVENETIVVAAIYLPLFDEMITAVKGEGCYLNGKRVNVNSNYQINNAIVSFGDYPHKAGSRISDWQHCAIKKLYSTVAKIRMFGAACIDFSYVASGKTEGAVVITNNLWDIAPGILVCREAGAVVLDLNGNEYSIGNDGVIVGADASMARLLADSFRHNKLINKYAPEKEYEGVVFDCDGVILDTESLHLKAWNKAVSGYGINISEEEYFPLRSTGRAEILNILIKKYDMKLSENEKQEILSDKGTYYREYAAALSEADVVNGVREYLEFLKSSYVKIGLATSSKDAINQLNKLDLLNYFEFVADGNNSFNKKPSPDIYCYLTEKMNIKADKCLVFEDSLAGIQSASSAGCDVICVGNHDSNGKYRRINNFCELL